MTKRKLLLVAIALCMVAILAVGGSLAYLTDDEQANNTMVIGDVKIDIDEYTYVKNEEGEMEWVPFEDDAFTMYPLNNDHGVALMNKVVYTANTSTVTQNDSGYAYIRNIVLIEANAKVTDMNEDECCFPGIHYGFYNQAEPAKSTTDGKTYYGSKEVGTTTEIYTIAGNDYYVIEFVEAKERPIPADACLYSLHSVWVDKDVDSEQMTGWEDKLEVLVFSQGIQAEGLTHAEAMEVLGAVNQTNLEEWLENEDGTLKSDVTFDPDNWTQK